MRARNPHFLGNDRPLRVTREEIISAIKKTYLDRRVEFISSRKNGSTNNKKKKKGYKIDREGKQRRGISRKLEEAFDELPLKAPLPRPRHRDDPRRPAAFAPRKGSAVRAHTRMHVFT